MTPSTRVPVRDRLGRVIDEQIDLEHELERGQAAEHRGAACGGR